MTTNPPEDPVDDTATDEAEAEAAPSAASEFAAHIASIVGSDEWSADFGNPKVTVDASGWVEAVRRVRDEAGLDFFSFLSAVDWSNDVAVGEPLENEVEERFEVLVRLSSGRNNQGVTLSTDVSKEDPRLPTLVEVYGGANWHEREAAEMFGIEFEGHPNLNKLYLTDEFEGYPLRKTFPLLSREVKPWPGTVDVEDMPSTENTEGEAAAVVPEEATSHQPPATSTEDEADGRGLEAASPEGEQ